MTELLEPESLIRAVDIDQPGERFVADKRRQNASLIHELLRWWSAALSFDTDDSGELSFGNISASVLVLRFLA